MPKVYQTCELCGEPISHSCPPELGTAELNRELRRIAGLLTALTTRLARLEAESEYDRE